MSRWIILSVALIITTLGACGEDDDGRFGPGSTLVGAACSNDGNCQSRCEDGICTVSCDHDGQCPGGTACIDNHGGICAPLCGSNADCGGFGPGWECKSTDRRGHDGSVAVCRN